MANMSYCRFYNTRMDVEDCLEALANQDIDSTEEKECAKRMLKSILNFFVDEGIIEENIDINTAEEKIDEMVNSCKEIKIEED